MVEKFTLNYSAHLQRQRVNSTQAYIIDEEKKICFGQDATMTTI